MERQLQLEYCKICNNKGFDMKTGIICKLTKALPSFENTCENFERNEKFVQEEKERERKRKLQSGDIEDLTSEKGVYQSKIRPVIGIIAILMIGILMIANPDSMQGEPTGRKILMKKLLKIIWGIPAGIAFIGLGIYLTYSFLKKHKIIKN